MSEAINTHGSVIAIGTTSVDPITDTYITIGEIVSFDGPGGSASVIDVSHLGSDAVEKRKGLKDNGQFTATMNRIFSNAGQQAVRDAQDDTEPYNFRITYDDGTTVTFKGLVMEFRTTGGGVNDVLRGNITVEVTGDITETVAP